MPISRMTGLWCCTLLYSICQSNGRQESSTALSNWGKCLAEHSQMHWQADHICTACKGCTDCTSCIQAGLYQQLRVIGDVAYAKDPSDGHAAWVCLHPSFHSSMFNPGISDPCFVLLHAGGTQHKLCHRRSRQGRLLPRARNIIRHA